MDRKSIIVLTVSLLLMLLWPKLVDQMYPRKPLPKQTNVVLSASNEVRTAAESPTMRAATNALTSSTNVTSLINADAPEELLVVTNSDGFYTFTSHGGGIKLITLKDYREAIECGKTTAAEARLATLNTKARHPVLAMSENSGLDDNGIYELSRTTNGVQAQKTLTNGLIITKSFHFETNFLLTATVRLENSATHVMKIPEQEIIAGTATPIGDHDNGMNVGAYWYNGSKAEQIQESWFQNKTLFFFPGTPRTEFSGGEKNVGWVAVHNQFFALAAIPQEPALRVMARRIELPPPSEAVYTNDSKVVRKPLGYETALVYPATNLLAGQAVERKINLYAGPREYKRLARIGDQFKTDLDPVMGFGFFGFFSKALLLSMNGLHAMGLAYGLAIIVITVIVKLLFWPLTNASTKSMKRMQALQPEIAKLKEKYKDDPQKLSRKQMEFFKEQKINPVAGCLPMLLQIPVFFGFYRMLQSAIELRGASFLWACDLSQADTVWRLPFLNNFPLNPMPLLMGITMLYQARITPVSPGVDPAQQKMMKYMPLMMMVFLYNMSAGLTLYWTVQNLLTILQTKMTKATDVTTTTGKTQVTIHPPKKKK